MGTALGRGHWEETGQGMDQETARQGRGHRGRGRLVLVGGQEAQGSVRREEQAPKEETEQAHRGRA